MPLIGLKMSKNALKNKRNIIFRIIQAILGKFKN